MSPAGTRENYRSTLRQQTSPLREGPVETFGCANTWPLGASTFRLPLSGDAATHIIRYASCPIHCADSLAVLPKTIKCPNCGLVLRVTQHARGSTTLIYDVNDWQRRCSRSDLGSPVMCLVQHGPQKPN